MFSTARKRALRDVRWGIRPDQTRSIEVWKYSPGYSDPEQAVRFNCLTDDDVEDWLEERGKYAPPPPPSPDARLVGGLRLIISEQEYYRPPSYSLSQASYLRVEEQFNLPQPTLVALSSEEGACSSYKEYDSRDPKKLLSIAFLIRAPQKYQVANYGLAASHDFTTGFTTGILHGTGVVAARNDYPLWRDCPSLEFLDLIKEVPHLSAEPLFLPTLLLQHHLHRSEIFCTGQLEGGYNDIQRRLGTTRAGRLHQMGPYDDPVGERTITETRVNLRNLTGELSTYMTEIIWYCRNSEWHIDYVDFLTREFDEISEKMATQQAASYSRDQKDVKDCIEFLRSAARGLQRQNTGAKDRAEADFSVLYSIIAQLDNRLNAKMSASASRDSTAMKTMAFITTLFLPGTFVAAIFSMDMFNWQGSESDKTSGRIISPYFWVYFVVMVPLTVLVAILWRVWWSWEKRNFDADVRMEIRNIEEPTSWPQSKEKLGKEPDKVLDGVSNRARMFVKRRIPASKAFDA